MDYRAREGVFLFFFFCCIRPEEEESESEASLLPSPPPVFARLCSFDLLSSAIDLFLRLLPARASRCWHPVGDASLREIQAFRVPHLLFKPVFLPIWVFLLEAMLKSNRIQLRCCRIFSRFRKNQGHWFRFIGSKKNKNASIVLIVLVGLFLL